MVQIEFRGRDDLVANSAAPKAGLINHQDGYLVDFSSIKVGASPRFTLVDDDHVKTLGEVADLLPPILVRRTDMSIVDGIHRYMEAKRSGRRTIAVRFFDGSPEEAYIEAIKSNVSHGKPLSSAERRSACQRLFHSNCVLSDRAIGEICGLSAKTVGQLRASSTDGKLESKARLGRDGRMRSVDPVEARQRAVDLIQQDPSASLRKIAREARVSPGVVRDVKHRLATGADPLDINPGHRRITTEDNEGTANHDAAISSAVPEFATWFERTAVSEQDWRSFVDALPLSRIYELVDEGRKRASCWDAFVSALELRVRSGR